MHTRILTYTRTHHKHKPIYTRAHTRTHAHALTHTHIVTLTRTSMFTFSDQVMAVFTEFPGNPLLKCPDVNALRHLADEFGFAVPP